METEGNYQNKLEPNRYAAFRNDNDDDWNTHVSQYVEREEKPGRVRQNRTATKRHALKEEETIRYLPYGTSINKVATESKRHAPHRVETKTKQNETYRVETNRFSQRRFATEMNRVIPTTNVGKIRIIPTKNDIPTENNKERMNLT